MLKEHFPGVRLSHDVCAVEALPDVCDPFFSNFIFSYEDFEDEYMQDTELLVAGFPCIDVSRAGLRRGLDGQVCCSPT